MKPKKNPNEIGNVPNMGLTTAKEYKDLVKKLQDFHKNQEESLEKSISKHSLPKLSNKAPTDIPILQQLGIMSKIKLKKNITFLRGNGRIRIR